MYLTKNDHVSRHVPYKKLIRDDNDNPVGILPQAFEMRENLDEKELSVNWLEYFGDNHTNNLNRMIIAFRLSRGRVGKNSAFGIGNVGILQDKCGEYGFTKVRVDHANKASKKNKSHARIIRLPFNNMQIMQCLAFDVFTELVPNKDVP